MNDPLIQEAADLARQVRAGGPVGLNALREALQTAGIGVLADDGSLEREPDDPSQGLAFRASTLASVMRSFEGGFRMNLADLSHAVQATLEELADQPIDEMILTGIRANAMSENETQRFWVLFIVELGRKSAEPYDLLAPTSVPATVNLDAIQFALILQRLAGDLYAFGSSLPSARNPNLPASSLIVVPQQSRPCDLGERGNLVMDMAAVASMKGFDALMGYLEEKGLKLPEKIASVTSVAGVIQSLLELLVTMLNFKAEISLEGGEPLVRTRDTKAGEQRQLIGKARVDTGNLQMVNCFRPVLNIVGLDFAVESDGALAGTKVEWVLPDNGGLVGPGSGGVGALAAIVGFYGGNPATEITDSQGVSRIGLEGTPQRREIRATAVPVIKLVTVGMNVQLQAADIVKDLLGGVDKVGGLSSVLELPVDLLKRTRWLFNARQSLDVRDWANDRVEIEGTGQIQQQQVPFVQTWNLDGTIELEAFGGGDQGLFKGRGRATLTKTYSGAMVGTYTYDAILRIEGEYQIGQQRLTFHEIEVSLAGANGSINCTLCDLRSVPASCFVKEYWQTCIVKTGDFENTAFFSEADDSYEIINEPFSMPLADGAKADLNLRNYFGLWVGTVTLRLGN